MLMRCSTRSCSRLPARRRASCPTTRVSRCTRLRSTRTARPCAAARGRHLLREVGRVHRRRGPRGGHGACSRSTTTAAPRRTRPDGTRTISRSSTRAPAAWTRCRSSATRSKPRSWRSSSSASSVIRRWSRPRGRHRSRSCSSTAGTTRRSRWPTTKVGRTISCREGCSRSTTCSSDPKTVARARSASGSARSTTASRPTAVTGSLRVLERR